MKRARISSKVTDAELTVEKEPARLPYRLSAPPLAEKAAGPQEGRRAADEAKLADETTADEADIAADNAAADASSSTPPDIRMAGKVRNDHNREATAHRAESRALVRSWKSGPKPPPVSADMIADFHARKAAKIEAERIATEIAAGRMKLCALPSCGKAFCFVRSNKRYCDNLCKQAAYDLTLRESPASEFGCIAA
jgi:hypothetical protein